MGELEMYAEETQKLIQDELEAEYCFRAKEMNDLHQMYLNKMQSKLNDAIQHADLYTIQEIYFNCNDLAKLSTQEKMEYLAYEMSDDLPFLFSVI